MTTRWVMHRHTSCSIWSRCLARPVRSIPRRAALPTIRSASITQVCRPALRYRKSSKAEADMEEDDLIPLSALQHYLYCPRQCALIHVEQQWADNRQTVEGRLQHQRADQPRTEQRHGVRTVTAMPLASPALGISGIADVVEFHGEQPFPIEYKRGRPKAHR